MDWVIQNTGQQLEYWRDNMQDIYVCSDLHLDHKNIIQYCNRPYASVEEMNEALINNWNSVVKENDTVFFLGDFCLGKKEDIISFGKRLNGRKILITGNHDHASKITYKEAGFISIYKNELTVHFDELNETITFSHRKVEEPEYPYFNIYGHSHDKACDDETHKCACVELWEYKPVLLTTILSS